MNIQFFKKGFNADYLSKNSTTVVNGFFILMVFFSHFRQYIILSDNIQTYFYMVITLFGQLMVAPFLFFSGYGVHENVKKKKEEYINSFFRKRFIKTYLYWCFAIILFLIVNIIMKNSYPVYHTLLSFVGWESIGNSNRYMFDIFILYIIFIISFKYNKKSNHLSTNIIITILFSALLIAFKEDYRYNTLYCFPCGMLFSKYKDKIDNYTMKDNKRYFKLLWLIIASFVILYVLFYLLYFAKKSVNIGIFFNIIACLFVIIISLLLMKINFKSKLLKRTGENLFWLYILQRIPMIIFQNKILNNYVYLVVCIVFTLLLTIIVKKILELFSKATKKVLHILNYTLK